MDYLESLRGLKGSALDGIARALYERDIRAFEEIIVRLAVGGDPRDYEIAATMLATALVSAGPSKNNYASARFGTEDGEEYVNMLISACMRLGADEHGYMPMLLHAQYAQKGGALRGWDKAVDRLLERTARADFDRAADLIDKYDRKFGKYSVLLKADRSRAIERLLGMALYGKNINKAAVRDVLMDYTEVADRLMSMYSGASAHDRVAIVRLLCAFKNDGVVHEFLRETVARDKSKSVREAAQAGIKTARIKNAAAYLENAMAEGVAHTVTEWTELLSDPKLGEVADRIFFYMPASNGRARVLVYNDGALLGGDDRPITDDGAPVYILHPLDVTADCAGILAMDIAQPFLQIKRPVFHSLSGENFCSSRLAGTMIARAEFYANVKRFGFELCAKRSADERNIFVRRLGAYVIGAECDLPESSATVSCGKLYYYAATDVVKLKRNLYISSAHPLDVRSVPRREFSELTYLAYKLFGEV